MALTATDIFLVCGYVLLISVYAQHLNSRESIAAVLGYTTLLVAKRLEYSHGKDHRLTKRTKQLGYSILFASPSYTHWHDLFAVVGYTYCVFGMFDDATPPLALYYVLGAENSASLVSMVGRAIVGPAIIMGYRSPLQ